MRHNEKNFIFKTSFDRVNVDVMNSENDRFKCFRWLDPSEEDRHEAQQFDLMEAFLSAPPLLVQHPLDLCQICYQAEGRGYVDGGNAGGKRREIWACRRCMNRAYTIKTARKSS